MKLIYARFPKAKEWAYLGFHDLEVEGKFVTIFGEPLSSTGFITWYPGTPDQHQGNEDCGSMHRTGRLNDLYCDKLGPWPFFCEFDLSWGLN
ncbi:hypothetical protein J437_LFUL008181 [Ladona fulva]|uniref:C-type lectin domain-containing protein n=1 Tax=Ladona fulva TaxID=123851 RepID=A0A8K0KCB7_LADFU|nr:hypothetical protein J437_LFUL008181 [Ladona fulva]